MTCDFTVVSSTVSRVREEYLARGNTSRAVTEGLVVDATIVRMVLVPAVMQLLGDRGWWLPRWLGRVVGAPAS